VAGDGSHQQIDLEISYANKLIPKALDTKFLGIHVDSKLSWKIHIEQIIHKLSAACYAMRSIKPFMSQETLKMVYYAYFHSIVNCVSSTPRPTPSYPGGLMFSVIVVSLS
jgi:hypothetical protein